ncbi:hypothetical protein Bbelb_290610 [Branchiostoma belcheri]|nr:hypothetical protein Bbelb_290610 [Branchiostoma belcheri]
MEKSQQELQRVRLNGKCNSAEEDTVYEKYRSSLSAQMYQPIQNSTFLTMWRESTFYNLHCTIKSIVYRKERQVYLGKVRASFDDPTAVLPIIIDGMNRNKTAIPHLAQKTKEDDKHLSQNISTPGEQRRKTGNRPSGSETWFGTFHRLTQYVENTSLPLTLSLQLQLILDDGLSLNMYTWRTTQKVPEKATASLMSVMECNRNVLKYDTACRLQTPKSCRSVPADSSDVLAAMRDFCTINFHDGSRRGGVILVVMHFNENANRAQGKRRDGEDMCTLHYPKYKKGGFIVRKVLEKETFDVWRVEKLDKGQKESLHRHNAAKCIPMLISLGELFRKDEDQAKLTAIETRLHQLFPGGTLHRTTQVYALCLWFTERKAPSTTASLRVRVTRPNGTLLAVTEERGRQGEAVTLHVHDITEEWRHHPAFAQLYSVSGDITIDLSVFLKRTDLSKHLGTLIDHWNQGMTQQLSRGQARILAESCDLRGWSISHQRTPQQKHDRAHVDYLKNALLAADGNSTSQKSFHQFFSEGKVMFCGGHVGWAHDNKMAGIQSPERVHCGQNPSHENTCRTADEEGIKNTQGSGVIDPRRGVDQGITVHIYKTLIRPHIEFGAALLVTDNSAASNSDREWYRSLRMTKATFLRICDELEPRLARRTPRLKTLMPVAVETLLARYISWPKGEALRQTVHGYEQRSGGRYAYYYVSIISSKAVTVKERKMLLTTGGSRVVVKVGGCSSTQHREQKGTPTWQTVALNHTDVCTEAHSVTWYGVGETLVAFTDSASHQVKVVMQSGQVQTLAGNGRPGLQDGTLPLAEFHQPRAENRVDYSGFEEEDTLRSHEEPCKLAAKARNRAERERIEKKYGARYSSLHDLPYFDVVRMHVIDPMHNLLEGTAKRVMQVELVIEGQQKSQVVVWPEGETFRKENLPNQPGVIVTGKIRSGEIDMTILQSSASHMMMNARSNARKHYKLNFKLRMYRMGELVNTANLRDLDHIVENICIPKC